MSECDTDEFGINFNSKVYAVPLNAELINSIETTIKDLSPFIQHPPLQLKFLRQPPFLYMHDLITNIIRRYGLLKDLYSVEELNRMTARTSKQLRRNFFYKLVTALRMTTGEALDCQDYRKLAIGHIPLLSNRLLQVIALALSYKMNSDEAIKGLNTVFLCGENKGYKRGFPDSIDDDKKFGVSHALKRFRRSDDSDSDSEDDEDDIDYCYPPLIENYALDLEEVEVEVWTSSSTLNESAEEMEDVEDIVSNFQSLM